MQPEYRSIIEVTGREPVGAVLTIGEKGPSGAPTNTDRFFVKEPQETRTGDKRLRHNHPAFAAYNAADPKYRTVIGGNLVHGTRDEAFTYYLRAQMPPKGSKWPTHPGGKPFCTGDGQHATRLYAIGTDGAEDYRHIPCPADKCEFRLGDLKLCKPFARLYFRPRWPEGSKLPAPLTKLVTQSWYSVSNILGIFEYVESQANGLGLPFYSLFGLPFTLTLTRKTTAARQRAFPVLTATVDCDLIAFLLAQREQIRQLGGKLRALPASALTPDEVAPEVIEADVADIQPGFGGVA